MKWLDGSGFHALFGLAANHTGLLQMSARAGLILLFAVVLFRLAPRRLFGRNSVLDIVLAVVLGSTLSRALTGNAPLLPTMAASVVLIGLHALVALVTTRSPRLGALIKGPRRQLIRDGVIDEEALAAVELSRGELFKGLRENAGIDRPEAVQAAYLEHDGQISVIPR